MKMQKEDLRIVFMGTPEFAVETLKALVENHYNVVAVVTQPDKPVGRHQNELQPSDCRGKDQRDKRQDIINRDAKLEMARAIKANR